MRSYLRSIVVILIALVGASFCFGATNAEQVDFLLSGSLKADGTVNGGGSVYTCDAGTACGPSASDPRTTWEDAAKAVAHANPIILDANGTAQVFADGNYRFAIYDSEDALVETIDGALYELFSTSSRTQTTITSSSQSVTNSDDTLLCNAASGAVTTDFSAFSAVGNAGKQLTFKKIDSSANTCTIDPYSTETVDGSTTTVLSKQNQVAIIESDGTNWIVVKPFIHDHSDNSLGGDLDSVTITNATFVAATLFDATLSGAPAISNFSSAVHTHADLVNGGVLFPYQDTRANFSFIDSTGVFELSDGNYSVGFQNIVVGWTGDIAWVANSTGTNANSDEMPTEDWYYIGIDNSVATMGTALTNSAFIGNTTAPTWNSTYHGWYTGSNRVIMAVFANSPTNALEFWHDGGDFVSYDNNVADRGTVALSDTWTDVNLTIPKFVGDVIRAKIHVVSTYVDVTSISVWRTDGSSANGKRLTYVDSTDADADAEVDVVCGFDGSDNPTIEVANSAAGNNTLSVDTFGWYFPKGM